MELLFLVVGDVGFDEVLGEQIPVVELGEVEGLPGLLFYLESSSSTCDR